MLFVPPSNTTLPTSAPLLIQAPFGGVHVLIGEGGDTYPNIRQLCLRLKSVRAYSRVHFRLQLIARYL